jgi:hypothetical protein
LSRARAKDARSTIFIDRIDKIFRIDPEPPLGRARNNNPENPVNPVQSSLRELGASFVPFVVTVTDVVYRAGQSAVFS